MLNKLQELRKRDEGFTIVEVMIVLAIAGLILLIVFLAIPALQRNSRNTQRKDFVANYGAAVTEALNNANGNVSNITTEPGTATAVQGYYNGAVTYNVTAAGAGDLANIDTARVYFRNGAKCTGNTPTGTANTNFAINSGGSDVLTTTGATPRNFVIVYAVEGTGTNVTVQCTET
ncbi:prepilin-type N-terminal cleavage/methylation domain-containing protein [Candidatus Saccharibacteria bacterium]|nr:prepilin-type N-terminal cleavage/methylation domain-containing protein [Candidatus Saccharibacteria bacterium]